MSIHKLLPCLLLLAACGDDETNRKAGNIQVTVYGEEFIEDEIPANDVADGWTIDFSKFLVVISGVTVGNHDVEDAFSAPDFAVFDLTKPSNGNGHPLGSGAAPGGDYDHAGYTIAPIASGAGARAANATADDLTLMADNGYSVYIQGTATKGGETITFSWGFTSATTYEHCETNAVVDGGTATSQITIHADHILYDSLVSETPDIRFDLIAGAAGDDDDVTLAELATVDISTLDNYQVGNNTSVVNLAQFLAAQVPTVGHIDGEGHCETAN